ncbi:hypothetical protein GS982_01730 [Rhodococcus hoagii]|uniref:Uncharacterized protein n=1 Tax=Rhodococcus hoagii TaxID=43767 RepID=A0A9Q4ZIM0_RHOHA|nr:hypothetical protein [Prescottella equi]NKT77318.1 hypothetical protein [Prescottella equi]NKZ81105.1 hypothetical protein [Prescottella equi]
MTMPTKLEQIETTLDDIGKSAAELLESTDDVRELIARALNRIDDAQRHLKHLPRQEGRIDFARSALCDATAYLEEIHL